MLKESLIIVGYILLIGYYIFVSNYIVKNAPSTPSDNVSLAFLIITGIMFAAFGIYKLFHNTSGVLDTENLYFIVGMFLYLTVNYLVTYSGGFKWTLVGILCASLLVIIPIIFSKILQQIQTKIKGVSADNTTSDNTNLLSKILIPFYTSYPFLFVIIIIGIVVLLTYVKKFNIPNLSSWQTLATVASIIFGLKAFLFPSLSYSTPIMFAIFLAVMIFFSYLIINPTHISQLTLSIVFGIACLLFAIIIPGNIPYLSLIMFILSLTFSVGFGLEMQSINYSTIQVLLSLLCLYVVVHFSNTIYDLFKETSASSVNGFKGTPLLLMFAYVIMWAVIFVLYFAEIPQYGKGDIGFLVGVVLMLCITLGLFGGTIAAKNYNFPITDGYFVGIFISSILSLLMVYYLCNSLYEHTTNYTLVFISVFFAVASIMMMAQNMKNILSVLLFIIILLFPAFIFWLFQNGEKSQESSMKGWMYFFGATSMLGWILATAYFWSNANISIASLFQMSAFNLVASAIMVYLLFYYVYLGMTSNSTLSVKFSQIVIAIIIGYLLLQIFKSSSFAQNPAVALIISAVEYIPCLYADVITRIFGTSIFGVTTTTTTTTTEGKTQITLPAMKPEDFTYHSGGVTIIAGIVVVCTLYYLYPIAKKWIDTQTHTPGISLTGTTIYPVNELNMICTYQHIAKLPTQPLYNYGISFYLWINPNTGNDSYYNILDFTGNLFVQYNTIENQMLIYALEESDKPEEITIYRYNQVPLQKWIKIEINYVGGIYDVFIDNKLKGSQSVVSYNVFGNVFIGETGSSVVGNVKDLYFYEKPLTPFQLQHTK